jgi:hypothetical protein
MRMRSEKLKITDENPRLKLFILVLAFQILNALLLELCRVGVN